MVLIDSNVLIDSFTPGSAWHTWSVSRMIEHHDDGIAINPIIYAEVSTGFDSAEALHDALVDRFEFLDLPWSAAFLAGRAFVSYRRGGGQRSAPLPDFYIGAHAQVAGLALLTRDPSRYRTYFPALKLITPA